MPIVLATVSRKEFVWKILCRGAKKTNSTFFILKKGFLGLSDVQDRTNSWTMAGRDYLREDLLTVQCNTRKQSSIKSSITLPLVVPLPGMHGPQRECLLR